MRESQRRDYDSLAGIDTDKLAADLLHAGKEYPPTNAFGRQRRARPRPTARHFVNPRRAANPFTFEAESEGRINLINAQFGPSDTEDVFREWRKAARCLWSGGLNP
jgi:hypothetical protein